MALLQILRPTLPILIGASLMLTLSMGLRQSFGIFMQPLTHDIQRAGSIPRAKERISGPAPPRLRLEPALRAERCPYPFVRNGLSGCRGREAEYEETHAGGDKGGETNAHGCGGTLSCKPAPLRRAHHAPERDNVK